MTVAITAVPGRRLTFTLRAVNADGTPADTSGLRLLFQARDTKGALMLSGELVPTGNGNHAATWDGTATRTLKVGHVGTYEVVSYPTGDPTAIRPLASGAFDVRQAIAVPE